MPKHQDFVKVSDRFVKQYGEERGNSLYFAWLEKKGYDDTKSFPGKKERKEKLCSVRGLEIKESEDSFHVEGLLATSHIDKYEDKIPKETLQSFADQINTKEDARVMGVFHSEGNPIYPEYFGKADFENNPASVVGLNDGEWGLFVDTKLLKNDPLTPKIIEDFQSEKLNAFSITYDTNRFMTTDFEFDRDDMIRVLGPETRIFGYTASNTERCANPNALTTDYGFKEFKELITNIQTVKKEVKKMTEKKETQENQTPEETQEGSSEESPKEPESTEEPAKEEPVEGEPEAEQKEFNKWKAGKRDREHKETLEKIERKVTEGVLKKMEMKEKVLKENNSPKERDMPLEVKEFREIIEKVNSIELKEQFRRAAAYSDLIKLDWQTAITTPAETREYKNFGVNGTNLEFKGLGIATNQNTDTDYLQSSAELQDVYDPVIYNALNQATVAWNLLDKDNLSKKGNNQVQFTLKTAANESAAFYIGNAVSTDNVTRLKYQTKFKKLQVGVSVDGDMIAAARGGPVNDVFAQEVMDSTMDMLDVLNAALFAEVGLETASAVIGFEYVADSAGNTTLYNLTRSAANKLSPDSATDTYINQGSTVVTMTNLRSAKRQATNEGANKRNLVFITNPVQADLLRGKFDDSRRMLTAKDTDFGFSTDLFVDGIPVFEDVDCNTDDWWLVDLETHRAAIWVPPTIERLGKTADSEDAFIKMYVAVYNRAPRRLVQIYGCATS